MKRWLLGAAIALLATQTHAATVSLLGCTFDTNTGTHTVTATPAAGDLTVIVVANTGSLSFISPTDDNSSGTYVSINSAVKDASADTMIVYIRTQLIGSAVSTIFTHAPGGTSGGGLCVLAVSGMSRVGSSASRQSIGQSNQAGGGTPGPTFSLAALVSNPVIGAVFNDTSPATMTPRASPAYTEQTDIGYSTPTTGLEIMTINNGETAQAITWGSTSASNFAAIVVELNSLGAPRPPRSASFGATQ